MVEELESDEFETPKGKDELPPAKTEMSDASAEEQDARDKENTFADIAAFLKKYNPAAPVKGRRDALDDRYLIKPTELLPDLRSKLSPACNAIDDSVRDRKIYAMICPRDLPYRLKNMEAMVGYDSPHVVHLLGAGTVEFSQGDDCKMVVVHETPHGKTVREVLHEKKTAFTEQFVIENVIAPLSDVLKYFTEKNISHGCINVDTVFLGDRVQLGECVSEPAGYSQTYQFESPERSQATPLGKGESTVATDCYALGILVLNMVMGLKFFERLDEQEYMENRLTLGTYNVLVGAKDFKALEDFLKGVLNDDPTERWGHAQVEQWVKGKKYNLLTPSVLREAQRPFNFLGHDYFNRRALAHNIYKQWEEAKTALRTNHLSRWVEVSLHKNDMAEAIRTVMERTGGIHSVSDKANNELVSRSICLLDPEGPVRYSMVSAFVDGLGVEMADAFRKRDQKRIQAVIEIVDYNFYNYVNDLLAGAKSKRFGNLLWKIQSCSRYLRIQGMGFGIERILYELNPTVACQSTLLANENVLTVDDLLGALDRMGTRKSKSFEYLDRHIAAFVANRMDITKEIKLTELQLIPALGQNPQLIVLHMLSQAQRKAGRPKLKGLSSWAALRVVPLIDNFHSRTVRKRIRQGLKVAAKSGELEKIFELLTDQTTIGEDHQGFQRAVKRFTNNAKQIAKFENPSRLKGKANQLGTILSMIVAYTTLLVTVGIVIKNTFKL